MTVGHIMEKYRNPGGPTSPVGFSVLSGKPIGKVRTGRYEIKEGKMSFFVYVSHKDPVDALLAARKLMERGHYPFVPQLNRLIPGRKDDEWENYFKMWLFRCDAIFLTESFREHELGWARSNHIPLTETLRDVDALKLPPFGELGRKFGMKVADLLPADQEWRKKSKEEVVQDFTHVAGIGAHHLSVAVLALKAWDRAVHG